MSLPHPLNWFLGCRPRRFNNPFSGCDVVKDERFGKWEAVVGIPPKSYSILQKNREGISHSESESTDSSDGTLKGQVNMIGALEWTHEVT